MKTLTQLTAGFPVLVGGDHVTYVSQELADAFQPGDRLLAVYETGDLLHIPLAQQESAAIAVGRAYEAFSQMGDVTDDAITQFYEEFATNLESEAIWKEILAANKADVLAASQRGRSTTRLEATEKMRDAMVAGLREWRDAPSVRNKVLERIEHTGWSVELCAAPLGVVGFVFEGRPNVLADATGVLRGGNTVVFRIGSDALGTSRAIMQNALLPALSAAGLPPGSVSLVDNTAHAAGWAMMSDPRLALAVARGSGKAVEQLGSLARQSGVPVSLHGTGGAWMVVGQSAETDHFASSLIHSLDKKRCNTLNVCCIPKERPDLIAVFLSAMARCGEQDSRGYRLHVVDKGAASMPSELFSTMTSVIRAHGIVQEPIADTILVEQLGTEWEWEGTPEISLVLIDDLEEAVTLCNSYSPHFIASLISEDPAEQQRFYELTDAPFVGNGFTRWVDGQFALKRPELGLSNWQSGRLFARGGILSGDSIYTIRTRVTQTDFSIHQ